MFFWSELKDKLPPAKLVAKEALSVIVNVVAEPACTESLVLLNEKPGILVLAFAANPRLIEF